MWLECLGRKAIGKLPPGRQGTYLVVVDVVKCYILKETVVEGPSIGLLLVQRASTASIYKYISCQSIPFWGMKPGGPGIVEFDLSRRAASWPVGRRKEIRKTLFLVKPVYFVEFNSRAIDLRIHWITSKLVNVEGTVGHSMEKEKNRPSIRFPQVDRVALTDKAAKRWRRN